MNRNINIIASVRLAMGALFGVAGSFFTSPVLQIILYEISTVGLTAACALLCIKFLRQKMICWHPDFFYLLLQKL